ncbi:nitroreductase [Cryobacterium sp. TMT1-21]|uniref:Putative NAD(P)H nitroreductase n=1 Tax=Cryobacterium shii TaxID=1259235 RepID=A0AAQ2C4H9_9MICO|nr:MULTISPECIES: nitroreductase family protein [Cryobacterium]TFC42813.1 nitroreductase [Cryobacterium shii]TFC86706.1 nitroreductase [Cryobacterium sp. TmT2-59]TFD14748.1 nitroreductase [Cryobacterium sp. TMT1-21]
MSALLDAVSRRRSHSKVTTDAPSHEELLPLVAAAARVADHGALRPWRLIEVRGERRRQLGDAFVAASGVTGEEASRLAAKPLRAELLIALIVSRRDSEKVAVWEQDAAAAGVGHILSLLLDDSGWGVMWRTGPLARTELVRRVHRLTDAEEVLGWLYVGGVPADSRPGVRTAIDPGEYLTEL